MTAAIMMERLENYVRENLLYARPDFVLEPTSSLIGTGVVDSMGIMELIAFISDEFGVTVEDQDITEPNLRSLAAITAFVSRKLDLSPAADVAEAEAGLVYEIVA